MWFSVYPTDPADIRDAVIAQACEGGDATLFTSLHIPEAEGLREYGQWLGRAHRQRGVEFVADISPATFERLGLRLDEAGRLRDWGVVGLRLDYGLDADEARALAAAGDYRISVNASTATPELLDELADVHPSGWHNFYPRPETGLAADFFRAQNALFAERGLPVLAFVPGETSFRAPLHLGLPTLEAHRARPSYVAAVGLRALCPDVQLVCAEGTLLPRHAEWLARWEATGELTLPLLGLDEGCSWLLDQTWPIRPEQTGISQRLEGTRGRGRPVAVVNAETRRAGSVQVDLDRYGRYAGEVHLMTVDRPLDPGQARMADVASPYGDLVALLRGRERVRFVTG